MLGIWEDMKELCPNAYVLNYVNPMGAMCTLLARGTGMKVVGLCHGVQTTMDLISGYTGVPKDEIDFINAGINHMDWFLTLTHKGKDLYPILRANMEKPEYYLSLIHIFPAPTTPPAGSRPCSVRLRPPPNLWV